MDNQFSMPHSLVGCARSARFSVALLCLIALALGACTSSRSSSTGSNSNAATHDSQASAAATTSSTSDTTQPVVLAISPGQVNTLGYRVDWRIATGIRDLKHLSAQHDSVFVVDGGNFLSRFRLDDGVRLWRSPVADPVEEILDIVDLPDMELILVVTPGTIMEIDRASGGLTGRQTLARIARTAPAIVGQFLVYGGRNGQVIWHSYPVKFQWRATQVARTISVPPIVKDGVVAVVGNDGEVMVLSAQQARSIWSTRLLDEVVAPPLISDGVLYVAGLDQHLRAMELASGRSLWKVLTTSPLNDAPIVLRNRLFQQIPGEGLVCFDALPLDSPGGKKIWTSPDVTGSVVTTAGGELICWDPEQKTIQVIDATYGSLTHTMKLDNVQQLMCTSVNEGTIYIVSTSGTVSRLVTKN